MANVFLADPNCVALWRFENGALTTDSKGTNTLTDNNTVGTEAVDYKEGAACADLEKGTSETLSITDANLDAGFPFKVGDTNKKFSACGWFKPESLVDGQIAVFSKYDSGGDRRTIMFRLDGTDNFKVFIGYNGGATTEELVSEGTPQTGRWYHFGITFDDDDKSYRVVIWDDTAGSKVVDASGTATNNISLDNAAFVVGGRDENGGIDYFFDGLIDEVVVFKDVLSSGEIDAIRQGTYTKDSVSCPAFELSASMISTPEIQIPCAPFVVASSFHCGSVFVGNIITAAPFIATALLVAPSIELQINCQPFIAVASMVSTPQIQIPCAPFIAVASLVAPTVWDGTAWKAWVDLYGDQCAKYYYFTLTGENETPAIAEVTIPISSFQARRKDGDPTFLSVVIPGTAYEAQINARLNGEMVIEMIWELNGTIEYQEELFRCTLDSAGDGSGVRVDEGGRNQSITLTGHKTESFVGKTVWLRDVVYRRDDGGTLAFRCASADLYLNPGDTARYGDDSFVVKGVIYIIGSNRDGSVQASMEVQEVDA